MAISKLGIFFAVACLLGISESFAVKRQVSNCAGPIACHREIRSKLDRLTLEIGNATAFYRTLCNGNWRQGQGDCHYDASLCGNRTITRKTDIYKHFANAICSSSANKQAVMIARGSSCFGNESLIITVTSQAGAQCFTSTAAQSAWAGPPTPRRCSTLQTIVRNCYRSNANVYCGPNSRDLMGLWADAFMYTRWPACEPQS